MSKPEQALRVARSLALLGPVVLGVLAGPQAEAQQLARARRPQPAAQPRYPVGHCPDDMPSPGAACTPAPTPPSMNNCPYGARTCHCQGPDQQHATWACDGPSRPPNGAMRGPLPPPELLS